MPIASAGRPTVPASLLILVSCLFLTAAVSYNRWVLSLIDPDPATAEWTDAVPRIRTSLALVGLVAGAGAFALARATALRDIAAREWFQKASLLLCVVAAPILLLELTLAPFVRPSVRKTTIYLRDPDLGWRHRPNAADVWDGRLVRINGKGLRGPELPYDKPAGVTRVLYLGDSVIFGDGLASDEDTPPYASAPLLARRLGRSVETVNAGVSGYSPWQEAIYLRSEGVRYHPDVVVLTFVLNDVTEKFELPRFGGSSPGWQVSHAYTSRLEQFLDRSSIALAARRLASRLRFGRNPRAAARRWEALNVQSLVEEPDREDVRYAWETTLREVDEIVDFCRKRRLRLALVVSPFLFQLEDPERLDAPQRAIVGHAMRRGVPVLDLLPVLAERIRRDGRPASDYFLDSNHYSRLGARVVAEVQADFLVEQVPLGPDSATQ